MAVSPDPLARPAIKPNYFTTRTDELALLEIGSRPASRPEAAETGELEALRAIPWVFAWTQNRCLLPAWYGCGTAFAELSDAELDQGDDAAAWVDRLQNGL